MVSIASAALNGALFALVFDDLPVAIVFLTIAVLSIIVSGYFEADAMDDSDYFGAGVLRAFIAFFVAFIAAYVLLGGGL